MTPSSRALTDISRLSGGATAAETIGSTVCEIPAAATSEGSRRWELAYSSRGRFARPLEEAFVLTAYPTSEPMHVAGSPAPVCVTVAVYVVPVTVFGKKPVVQLALAPTLSLAG